MVAQALMPYAIGQAIQQGIVDGEHDALVRFCALLAVLGVVQAAAGVMRHRYAVQNWLQASFRLVQVVGYHAARSGDAVRAQLSTGEVVATVSNDALRAGGAFDILARLVGGIVSYVVVAAILLTTSIALGLLVLIGVPLLTVSLSFVIRPLQRRQREQREEVGLLTALGADTAAGPPRAARGRRRAGVLRPLPAALRDACASPASGWPRRSRRSTRPRCSCPGSSSSLVTWIGRASRRVRARSRPASSSRSTGTPASS